MKHTFAFDLRSNTGFTGALALDLAELGFAKLKDLILAIGDDLVAVELRGHNHPFAVLAQFTTSRPSSSAEAETKRSATEAREESKAGGAGSAAPAGG